jgi:probable addiction module antidote protein
MSKSNQLGCAPFDASDYLDNEDTIAEYLAAALENPDPEAFLVAIRDVAKARGKVTENLYKELKPGAQPRFETVRRLIAALGVRLNVVTAQQNHA